MQQNQNTPLEFIARTTVEALAWLGKNVTDGGTRCEVMQFLGQMDEEQNLQGRPIRGAVRVERNRTLQDGTNTDLYVVDFLATDAPDGETFDPRNTHHYFKHYQFYLVVGENEAPIGFVPSVKLH